MKDIPEVDDRYLYYPKNNRDNYLREIHQLLLRISTDIEEIKDIIVTSKKEEDSPLSAYMNKLIKKVAGGN